MTRLLLAVAFALAAPVALAAGTISGSLPVTATVTDLCTIDMTGKTLVFGAYSPAAAKNGAVALNVKCTAGTTASMAINGGGTGKTMTSPSKSANLSFDVLLTDGDGALPSAATMAKAADATGVVKVGVSGTIPAGQYVPAAADYAGTIQIDVAF